MQSMRHKLDACTLTYVYATFCRFIATDRSNRLVIINCGPSNAMLRTRTTMNYDVAEHVRSGAGNTVAPIVL